MKDLALGSVIFDGEEMRDGFLRVQGSEVVEVCSGAPSGDFQKGLVLPGFVNAHTHIGDSFAYPAPKMPLEELVAHPGGYKHRVLRAAARSTKADGITQSLDIMTACGTAVFADFREEGLEGIRILDGVLRDLHPRAVRLCRPVSDDVTAAETKALLAASEGFGMSSVSDHRIEVLERLSKAAHAQGKLFSIHVSEVGREDIESVLSLRPDFVVHAAAATDDDLAALAAVRVPVVVCPRSNEFFGIQLDIPRMLAAGLTLALGTDNGMVCKPDMIEEVKAAFRLSMARGGITPLDALRMGTVLGRKVLKAEGNTTAGAESEQDFTVVRAQGKDPAMEMVTAVESRDVLAVVRGGKVRRFTGCR